MEQLVRGDLAAMRADLEQVLYGTRSIIKALSSEVTDCPRLFSVDGVEHNKYDPRRIYDQRFKLTLWYEEPAAEHPIESYYIFRRPKEWFADVAPYLVIAARAIALLAPSVGAASAIIQGGETEVKRIAEFMNDLAVTAANTGDTSERPSGIGLTRGEGAALRRFRELLYELDPGRRFGELRRVLSPTGDYLWVCERHYRIYEPGMPNITRGENDRNLSW